MRENREDEVNVSQTNDGNKIKKSGCWRETSKTNSEIENVALVTGDPSRAIL